MRSLMFKKYLLTIILFISVSSSFSQKKMTVLIDNYSIKVPSGWMAQYTNSAQVFFLFSQSEQYDQFQENCNLSLETVSKDVTVTEYKKNTIENLKTVYSTFLIIEKGKNFHKFKCELKGQKLQQIQYFYKKGVNTMLILTFTSDWDNFDRYKETFQQIAKSFKYK